MDDCSNPRAASGKQMQKKKSAGRRGRPGTSEDPENEDILREREATRKRLKQDFSDVHVEESNMRSTSGRDFPLQGIRTPPPLVSQQGLTDPSASSLSGVAGPTNLGRPPKRRTTRARLIESPSKSRDAVTAGIPGTRTINTTDEHLGTETRSEKSENNDYCEACGGQGYLLCCDGCDRAFHLSCCDPPLENTAPLDAPYYCHHCESQNEDPEAARSPIFAELLANLMKRNPESYILPDYIRFNFEGNTTAPDGSYVQTGTRNARPGQATQNYRQTRETDTSLRQENKYCYACGESTWNGPDHAGSHADPAQRDIVPCDTCGLFWHTDCLDPPRAHVPSGTKGGNRVRFTCPHHTSQDLHAMDPITGVLDYGNKASHHIRIPKRKRTITPTIPRGVRTQGNIEIISDDDDDDDGVIEEFDGPGGVTYRLPRKAVKLDFLHKVKVYVWNVYYVATLY